MAEEFIMRIAKAYAGELTSLWDEIRGVEGIDPEYMLANPQEVERFDAATAVEWIVQLTESAGPILTGVLGYLVAKKGEVEIDGMKFKNMSVRDIEKIIQIIRSKKKM